MSVYSEWSVSFLSKAILVMTIHVGLGFSASVTASWQKKNNTQWNKHGETHTKTQIWYTFNHILHERPTGLHKKKHISYQSAFCLTLNPAFLWWFGYKAPFRHPASAHVRLLMSPTKW